ncbi:MAG TPA: pyridoxal phosphate-dependent aminotransferase [Gammaproteobacteria bacterium]|nr:pyridoxal phosphate-dependent aminotransferase [Gammaproteobacteria bacterium]
MEPDIAQRLAAVSASPTLAISALAKDLKAQGRDVLDLSAGEPDFITPAHIRAAGIAALERGDTHYTATDGTPALKSAIAAKFSRENRLEFTAEEIIATAGVKQALFNLCLALLDPGDEVLIPAPYWVSYPTMAQLAGAEPRILAGDPASGFKLAPATLAAALTPRTRLLFLNSPCNPSGASYSRRELDGLAEVLRTRPDVLVATDDIYEHLIYGDEEFANILMAAPDLRDRCVVVNGVSKSYAMTGWRIGYAAGPVWLIKAMKKLQSHSTSNPAAVSQAAAAAALAGPQDCVREMKEAFRARRDRFVAGLNRIRGLRCALPDGAFYAFADCREAMAAREIGSDGDFAAFLLREAGIAAVPGGAFGGPGHLRFSYACDQSTLDAALERLDSTLGES